MSGLPDPVEFKIGVDTYKLRLGFGAICAIEDQYDTSFLTFAADMAGPEMRLSRLLSLFHALLLKDQPDMTKERAGLLLEELGAKQAGDLMGEALKKSPLFADAEEKPKPKPKRAAR